MMWALRVYGQGIKIGFTSAMAYRADFILNTLISLAGNMVLPLITLIIYSTGAYYPGWSFHETLLVQGIFMMSMGLSQTLFSSMVWVTMQRIKEGSFDLLMIRPGPVIVHVLASGFSLEGMGPLVGGAALFAYSLSHLPAPGAMQWLLFLMMFIMGVCVVLGCVMVMSASAFRWVGNSRIFEIFDSVASFGKYPAVIFPRAIVTIISFCLPVAMIGFFPASALLDRISAGMLAAMPICLAFLGAGILLYRTMVRQYQSAGG